METCCIRFPLLREMRRDKNKTDSSEQDGLKERNLNMFSLYVIDEDISIKL